MKKLLGILGGIFLMSSISGSVASCSTSTDYSFNLTTSIGEVIDTFDKRDVEDYYLDGFFTVDEDAIYIFISFKSKGSKGYGVKSGRADYWLKHLVTGLNLKPAQEKYKKKPIPQWVWEYAGLWDYENNKPED